LTWLCVADTLTFLSRGFRRHLTFANVASALALFLTVSGGTAVALTGSNTVFSDDIVNGEVKAADIGNNAVGSAKIVDGSVQGVDIFDGTVDSPDILDGAVSNNDVRKNAITSGKVQDESLTGADVNESTLGTVPSAASANNAKTLGGVGPGGFVSSANVRRVFFDSIPPSQSDDSETVLQVGPLTLSADCYSGFGNSNVGVEPYFHLDASTSAQEARFDVGYVSDGDHSALGGGGFGASGTRVLNIPGWGITQQRVGNFVYNDRSTTISIPFTVFYSAPESGGFSPPTHCLFTGIATRVTGPPQ
jgi:hypothetical protein